MIIEPRISGGRSASSSAWTTTGSCSRQDVMSRWSVSTYADRPIRIRRRARQPTAGYKPPAMAKGMKNTRAQAYPLAAEMAQMKLATASHMRPKAEV